MIIFSIHIFKVQELIEKSNDPKVCFVSALFLVNFDSSVLVLAGIPRNQIETQWFHLFALKYLYIFIGYLHLKGSEHNQRTGMCISDPFLLFYLRFIKDFACGLEFLQETLLQWFICCFALCLQ